MESCRYRGVCLLALLGLFGSLAVGPAVAQFPAEKVAMYSHVTLRDMGASSALDCWGYVSESGREYAIVGLNTGTSFVEITDPSNPVVVGMIPRGGKDMKVYKHYVYSSTDGGPFLIIDVGDIDNGNIKLVKTINRGTHNIVLNEESGFVYLAIGGPMVALDLSDPENPVEKGTWGGETHDAQVVTYTEGKYKGREIAFILAGRSRRLDIVDVTDKGNMKLMGSSTYRNGGYTHQGWLSNDRRYFYVGDEFDERQGEPKTRTIVFDVSDLENPKVASEFSGVSPAIDHNQYVRDGFLYQANYTAGLQIYDITADPLEPPRVGFFDTYPNGDPTSFNGAWSTYPFFPSGTVIVSDRSEGLLVLDVSEAVGGGNVPSACCFAKGSCKDLKPDKCRKKGGRSNFGKECGSFDCPQRGACCIDNNTCDVMLERDCNAQGGDFKGEGQRCKLACPCDLIKRFKAGCGKSGTIKATVKLKNKSRDGETLKIQVGDRLKFDVTIHGKKARLFTCCYDGEMEVSLIDPDGCVDPITVDCK